jgi:hypothetical protein
VNGQSQHDEISRDNPPSAKVLQLPAVIEYKVSVARILSWQDALVEAWQRGTVSNGDALDLLVLRRYARDNGALCLSNRNDPHGWWTAEQLGQYIRLSRPTFRARWLRWERAGWVESRKPANRKHPVQRWLGKVPGGT